MPFDIPSTNNIGVGVDFAAFPCIQCEQSYSFTSRLESLFYTHLDMEMSCQSVEIMGRVIIYFGL